MAKPRDERPSRAFRRSRRYRTAAAGLGATVRSIRKERRFTLEKAAELAGLDFRHLQQIEVGDINVTLATILRLADGLGVEPAILLADGGAGTNLRYGAALRAARVAGPGVPPAGSRKAGAALPNPLPPRATAVEVQRALGRAVAAYRRHAGMTQRELAARVGVAVQYVQRVEGGKQNLTIATCVKFANALGVGVGDLFEGLNG